MLWGHFRRFDFHHLYLLCIYTMGIQAIGILKNVWISFLFVTDTPSWQNGCPV